MKFGMANVMIAVKQLINNKVMDEWDIKLIKLIKHNHQLTLNDLMVFWCERCEIDIEYVYSTDILDGLVEIVEKLGILNLQQFVLDILMENRWKFSLGEIKKVTPLNVNELMVENMIWVLCSRIRLTEVSKIPNYSVDSL